MRHRSPRCLAPVNHGQKITPRDVRRLMAIGLKSDEELHPDFHDMSGGVELAKKDFPATGELPVRVQAEPEQRLESAKDDLNISGEARESTKTGPELKEGDSRGGQQPLLNLTHVFREVERRFGV